MEAFVQGVEGGSPSRKPRGFVADIALELVQGGDDLALPGGVAARHAEPQRLAFDHAADAHDVGEILARDRLDAKAALADGVDEAARGQPRQRLAQRRRADAVARRRLGDAEAAVGRERAGENVGLDRAARRARSAFARRLGVTAGPAWPVSICRCSMPCCFIISIHQVKSSRLQLRLRDARRVQLDEVDRHLGELRDATRLAFS